jgi:hypothetical protein
VSNRQVDTAAAYAAAYNNVFENVTIPVFVDKLAQHGYQPTSQSHLSELLKLGQQLLQLEQLRATKQASAAEQFVADATAELDQYFGTAAPQLDDRVKLAADYVVNDPALIQSMLTVRQLSNV